MSISGDPSQARVPTGSPATSDLDSMKPASSRSGSACGSSQGMDQAGTGPAGNTGKDLHTGQQSEQRPQGVSQDDVHEKQFPAPETAPGFKGDRDQAAPDMLK